MAMAQRLQGAATAGAAAMTNLQEGAKPLRGLGRTALPAGLPISAGLLLSAVVVVGAVWQPGAGSARAKQLPCVCGPWASALPCCVSSGLRQLEAASERQGVSKADLLAAVAGSGELSNLSSPAQSERPPRAGVGKPLSGKPPPLFEPTPPSGGRARPETACRLHPQPRGKPPRREGIPLEAPGPQQRAQHCLSARGASQPAGFNAPG